MTMVPQMVKVCIMIRLFNSGKYALENFKSDLHFCGV